MKKEMEKQDRERRKEEERLLREKQRQEEKYQREERREHERREKFLQKELLKVGYYPNNMSELIVYLYSINCNIYNISLLPDLPPLCSQLPFSVCLLSRLKEGNKWKKFVEKERLQDRKSLWRGQHYAELPRNLWS